MHHLKQPPSDLNNKLAIICSRKINCLGWTRLKEHEAAVTFGSPPPVSPRF